MKDIIIKPTHIRRELIILLICLVIAFILNIVSIIAYKTAWSELFSQLHYVLAISVALYLLFAFVRLVIGLVKPLFRKSK